MGSLLSGGIDSSLVVAFMRRHASGPVDTYSVGFSDQQLDESFHARLAAEYLGTRHHEIRVDDCTPDLLERLVWHLDEPVADPAIVPTYVVCRLARDTVTVVLTGEGGDELFAGYDYYHRRAPWSFFSQLLPEALGQQVLPGVARTLNRLAGRPRYHERTIWHMALPASARMLAWVAVFTEEGLRRLWRGPSGDGADCTGVARAVFTRLHDRHGGIDKLHRSMYIDTEGVASGRPLDESGQDEHGGVS